MTSLVPNQRGWVIYCILFFLFPGKIFAQLSADFSASTVSGCAPVVVYFTDQSKGSPTQWKWDLGNGVTSTLQNPSATYFNPGTYKIKLIIRSSAGADSVVKDKYISVYPHPVAAYSLPDSSGCFPFQVQYTNNSTTSSGTIAKTEWDFGDGTLSSSDNPAHVYTAAGNFSVTLKVTNSFGCTKTVSTKTVRISNGVTASFTNSVPAQCKAPITIQFTNSSSGPEALMYTWDFGDGNTSTDKDPVHTYTSKGSFTVKLVTVSAQGCRDTIIKQNLFSIGTTQSDFTTPATICEGVPFNLQNTTSPMPGEVVWNFGDGSNSQELQPSKIYTTAGSYEIKLVNNFGGCKDSIAKTVVVNKREKAAFEADQTVACKIPSTISFTNKTGGNNSYKWFFGDGTTSTATNPNHAYNDTGSYTVTLIVTNAVGCSDTLTKEAYITIKKPEVTIYGFPQGGCNPLTVNPTASVVSNDAVVKYAWNFGDGGVSSVPNPVYVYRTSGVYDVVLTVTTANGCTSADTILKAVKVGDKPGAKFTLTPKDACASQSIVFTDNTTGKVDQWLWLFGDGEVSTVQNTSHQYSDTGYFDVTLIAYHNMCADTITIKDIVHIRPPIAKSAEANSCTNKYTKTFFDQSIGAESWLWSFGDGTTSSLKNPTHTYAKKGVYTVTLFITNGSCTHTTSHSVSVIDEKASFATSKQTVCKGGAITFTPKDISAGNIVNWRWDFGDGTTVNDPTVVSHVYAATGIYTVKLTITDSLGCESVMTSNVKVYGPSADFKTSASGICIKDNKIVFTDDSKTDGTNSIAKWMWNYGDGTVDGSGLAPYQHSYKTPGEYTVSLKVVDAFGCSDSISKAAAVIVAQPIADFISRDTLSCINKPIEFTNRSQGYNLQYQWNFGDGNATVTPDAIHKYNAIGSYTVKLLVTDKYGCQDSVLKNNFIQISYPSASFTMSDSISTCPPLLVKFTNTSKDYTSVQWDFDDGNTSTLESPSHYYTTPGIFYPKLIVTGPGGCTEIFTKKVEVRGPRGSFIYAPQVGCKPLSVTFTATTLNKVSFVWDFTDGNTLSTKDSVVTHTYIEAGDYVPKMIITDESGCSVPIVGKDTIKVVGVTAAFDVGKNFSCNSASVNFKEATISNDLITQYEWSFGDGKSSTQQHPVHAYDAPGLYTAQLIATTQTGCKDSVKLSTPITIYKGPVAEITGALAACMPAKLTFGGNVAYGDSKQVAWRWSFRNGQSATVQNPVEQHYPLDGSYALKAIVKDENGCIDSVVKEVVIHPLPNVSAGQDALVCRDQTTLLQATGAATYVWANSPYLSCTDCARTLAAPDSTKTFVVTGTTEFGCSRNDTVVVRVRQRFNLMAYPGDTICIGRTVNLWAAGADQYAWYPSSGLDNTLIAKPKAKPGITTAYSVVGMDNDHCFSDTAVVLIKVNPLPTVDAGADITMSAGGFVQLKPKTSADVVQWRWTPGASLNCVDCQQPIATPKAETKYAVQVKNEFGCVASDNVTVSVICNNGNLFIPNTFSPNGDGNNDQFYPRGTGIAMVKALRIFNRWGELVFERINFNANDASAGWDGMYKGQKLSPDVYIYSCEVICTNNEVIPFKGDITLLQ